MTKKELAIHLHRPGSNCAQSVLRAFTEETGLDEATASAIANGFGGGVRCGEICGAISGGVMALGLMAQNKGITDVRKLTADYVAEFTKAYGCVRCEELKQNKIPCDELIGFAAEVLEKYM